MNKVLFQLRGSVYLTFCTQIEGKARIAFPS